MDPLILNVIHRPEMVPEYSATVTGQGKEEDIVIFSMTRTTGSYRFLADERRLNVALSRAKDQIFIVGNKEYCEKSVLLQSIMERCEIKIV